VSLQGIINSEVFEKEFTAEEKNRLMLLLPEVDRRDPQTLAECLRFNTHLNVAMQVRSPKRQSSYARDSTIES
jgi:hypothetical protein